MSLDLRRIDRESVFISVAENDPRAGLRDRFRGGIQECAVVMTSSPGWISRAPHRDVDARPCHWRMRHSVSSRESRPRPSQRHPREGPG